MAEVPGQNPDVPNEGEDEIEQGVESPPSQIFDALLGEKGNAETSGETGDPTTNEALGQLGLLGAGGEKGKAKPVDAPQPTSDTAAAPDAPPTPSTSTPESETQPAPNKTVEADPATPDSTNEKNGQAFEEPDIETPTDKITPEAAPAEPVKESFDQLRQRERAAREDERRRNEVINRQVRKESSDDDASSSDESELDSLVLRDNDNDEPEHESGGPSLDTDLDMNKGGEEAIAEPSRDNLIVHKDELEQRRLKKEERIQQEDSAEEKTSPRVPKTIPEDIEAAREAEVVKQKLRYAELNRYKQSIDEPVAKERLETKPESQQLREAEQWSEKNPRFKVSDLPQAIYESYIAKLSLDEIDDLFEHPVEEQDELITEKAEEDHKTRQEVINERKKNARPVVESVDFASPDGKHLLQKFLDGLSEREYAEFKRKSVGERDAMIRTWRDMGLDKLSEKRRNLVEALDGPSLQKFEAMSDTEKLQLIYQYRDGGAMQGLLFKDSGGFELYKYDNHGRELDPPSYHTYDKYKNDKGEEYYEVISAHKRRYNTLTPADKALLRTRDRVIAYLWGKLYVTVSVMADFEQKIAEENKKNQEMIRNIVDTGPDMNERIVFAQRQSDGTYMDYNGNVVSPEIVRSMQKKALHNPSRFQALCHYELSKREEPEQARLWEEIFSMMAHHGYNKYAMWGVVIGLQFMNKPSYLFYKNAVIEWMPEYETEMHTNDKGESHLQFKRDDNDQLIEKRYTIDNIYETGVFGKKLKVDTDGNPVQIGDVIRSKSRARFATEELILQPGDQEYNETKPETRLGPNGPQERYLTRTRIIRSETDKDENGEYKILRKEEYKVKTILKVKEVAVASELFDKFNTYQYGFRAADVAITYDLARRQYQIALACARSGDFTSKKFQIAMYTLSRLKMTVDGTRLSGASGGEGAPGEAEFAQQQRRLVEAENAKRAGTSDKEAKRGFERTPGGYPPRISGTAGGNVLWGLLATLVDHAAEQFPNMLVLLNSDYQAVQEPELPHSASHDSDERAKVSDIRSKMKQKKKDDKDKLKVA